MAIKKVLIIDNDTVSRSRIVACVGDHCEVLEAEDGVSGLSYFLKCAPDLVFVNWKLPFMDASSFYTNLKASPSSRNTQIVFMTSWLGTVHKPKEKSYLSCSFIEKPLKKQDIQHFLNVA